MSATSDHALGDTRFGCKHSSNNENPRCQGFHRSLPYDRPLAAAVKLQSSLLPTTDQSNFAGDVTGLLASRACSLISACSGCALPGWPTDQVLVWTRHSVRTHTR